MNALSITMTKDPTSETLQLYAFRLMATMVTCSWAGLQILTLSGCYQKIGDPLRAEAFFDVGMALLLGGLLTLLCLKRREAVPTRESAQLFFWAFLVVLPGATWWMWDVLKHMLAAHGRRHGIDVTEKLLFYSPLVISATYAALLLIWLNTNVIGYEQAKPGARSVLIMQRLKALLVEPYLKNN
jgi:hypothetical protein